MNDACACETDDCSTAERYLAQALAQPGGDGWAAGELTSTERQVARLVADGLRNREIGARLYRWRSRPSRRTSPVSTGSSGSDRAPRIEVEGAPEAAPLFVGEGGAGVVGSVADPVACRVVGEVHFAALGTDDHARRKSGKQGGDLRNHAFANGQN